MFMGGAVTVDCPQCGRFTISDCIRVAKSQSSPRLQCAAVWLVDGHHLRGSAQSNAGPSFRSREALNTAVGVSVIFLGCRRQLEDVRFCIASAGRVLARSEMLTSERTCRDESRTRGKPLALTELSAARSCFLDELIDDRHQCVAFICTFAQGAFPNPQLAVRTGAFRRYHP